MKPLFEIEETPTTKHTCRHCAHRFTAPLSAWSKKVLQCCELKKGRNNAGYKTIKVTDTACSAFIHKQTLVP